MEPVTIKMLLEAGAHFGHPRKGTHPTMRKFIFTQRNGIFIIDLEQTVELLQKAREFARDVAARGDLILFVGTKRQAQESIEQEAKRCGMPYVNQRWLGGTLTNFSVIRSRALYLKHLKQQKEAGGFAELPKKEAMKLEKKLARLERLFGGIEDMDRLPGAVFITDTVREKNAIAEARKMKIPIIAIADTDCDLRKVDYPIPANDDAVKSLKLIISAIADAIIEGKESRASAGEGAEETE